MSVEFRQRKPGEYARIVWKRKWLIVLPAIAITLAIAWVVYRLPDVYESVTLIVVKPSTIPTSVVPSLSDDTLTRQLNNINQVVTSRSSLQPLVERYDLYAQERLRGEPMESVIDRMRRDIHVEVNTSRNDITNGFNITYRGRDPRTTQAVARELASRYIDEQTKATVNVSTQTKEFFGHQVEQAKSELDEIDRKRLEYMQAHVGSLPSEYPSLIGQLAGLREQQKALIAEIGRLRDQRTALSNQLSDLERQSEQDREQVIENTIDPRTTTAYAELVKRKADLDAEYQSMATTLKPKNPDMVAKKSQIDNIQAEIDRMLREWKNSIEEKRRRIEGRPDLRLTNLKSNLQLIQGEQTRLETALNQNNVSIAEIEARINGVPSSEVALEALNREYQTKKSVYDSLLTKQTAADLGAAVASNAQGETIQVIDPANLPSRPVAPKRLLLTAVGLMIGLAVGLLFAAVFEVPRLLTIQTTEDARHYTGLPVLVSVPELLTPQEARRIPQRRMLLVAAGIVITILSIPGLAFVLKRVHIFDIFVS